MRHCSKVRNFRNVWNIWKQSRTVTGPCSHSMATRVTRWRLIAINPKTCANRRSSNNERASARRINVRQDAQWMTIGNSMDAQWNMLITGKVHSVKTFTENLEQSRTHWIHWQVQLRRNRRLSTDVVTRRQVWRLLGVHLRSFSTVCSPHDTFNYLQKLLLFVLKSKLVLNKLIFQSMHMGHPYNAHTHIKCT